MFGDVNNYCIFAPLFKMTLRNGRQEGFSIQDRIPFMLIQSNFKTKDNLRVCQILLRTNPEEEEL